MGPGRLFGLVLVLVLFLGVLSTTQDSEEQIPQGASTLAFVFDVTGSMYDDLVQVIEGASKILETSLSRPKRPLYNFALVPFHDPGKYLLLSLLHKHTHTSIKLTAFTNLAVFLSFSFHIYTSCSSFLQKQACLRGTMYLKCNTSLVRPNSNARAS